MMRELKTILLCIPFLWTNVHSQQLSHQVLVPLAGVTSANNLSYSQTVGETAVEITENSYYILTQGFQQPRFRLTSEVPPAGTGVKVYPNPVSDHLIIELYGEAPRTFIIEYINISGKIIRSERKVFGPNYWFREPQNVTDLLGGLYMIRIKSEDRLFNRTFRIEKI